MPMRSQELLHKPFMKRKTRKERSSGHEAIVAFQHILQEYIPKPMTAFSGQLGSK